MLMIGFAVIVRAVRGESDAVDIVLHHYRGYINWVIHRKMRSRSVVYDAWTVEQIRCDIETTLIWCILKFEVK
ncbi:MAG: helix-turn-helix domain-containing protein [Clostridia bacterium]|nr:helix-turn-helix domain-containing protein [Clostridia bacterium]